MRHGVVGRPRKDLRYPAMGLMVTVVAFLFLVGCGVSPASAPTKETPLPTAAPTVEAGPPVDLSEPEIAPPEEPIKAPPEVPAELKAIWEAWSYLRRDYVDRAELDPAAVTEAAIKGMVDSLGDPHTSYIPPDVFAVENEDIEGKFEGIGAEVTMRRDGKLIVVAPIAGSPAEAAGLRPGDVILAVDGESIEGVTLLEAVRKIRGPKGTTVRLLIQRLGVPEPQEVEIVRGVIPLESVRVRSRPGDKIAHIRLTSFFPDTPQKLRQAIQEAVDSGAQALILDVRDNPGGLLTSAVEVASLFLEPDQGLVLYEVDGTGRRKNWRIRPTDSAAKDLPMVVLVNEGSASASELVAGALQDHKRATIVGAPTFGKGSVNILRPLSNGGGLSITVARWYTPSGRLIQGKGIEPDVLVTSLDRRDADIKQLEKAIEILEEKLQASSQGDGSATAGQRGQG